MILRCKRCWRRKATWAAGALVWLQLYTVPQTCATNTPVSWYFLNLIYKSF